MKNEHPKLAVWFTIFTGLVAALYAVALCAQLFLYDVLPFPSDTPDPFEKLPSVVYVIESIVLAASAAVALVRMRASRHAVTVSLVGAIVLLPACPWTIASIIWLVRDYRQERDWSRNTVDARDNAD